MDLGYYMNSADFLRQAVREKLETIEVVELRKVAPKKAKQEILAYLQKHGRTYASDVADALRLDIGLVMSQLKELVKEGRIR